MIDTDAQTQAATSARRRRAGPTSRTDLAELRPDAADAAAVRAEPARRRARRPDVTTRSSPAWSRRCARRRSRAAPRRRLGCRPRLPRVEAIRAGSTTEAAALRKRVDEDIAGIREWSKVEMARIRAETERSDRGAPRRRDRRETSGTSTRRGARRPGPVHRRRRSRPTRTSSSSSSSPRPTPPASPRSPSRRPSRPTSSGDAAARWTTDDAEPQTEPDEMVPERRADEPPRPRPQAERGPRRCRRGRRHGPTAAAAADRAPTEEDIRPPRFPTG